MPILHRSFLALAILLTPLVVRGQDNDLRLLGVHPGGLRTSVTESWGTLHVAIVNPTETARDARVMVLYPDRSVVQFGRDVWVPARSTVSTWVPVGPAPAEGRSNGREIQALLYDRTGGANRLILPPSEERVRSRLVLYRPRAATTAILTDYPARGADADEVRRLAARNEQASLVARLARAAAGLPQELTVLLDAPLPPTPEAFDGIDHLVLAGNRLASDPAGRQAVRHFVEQGGRLWVMLDLVDPETIAALLGDDLPLQVVDRVGLTTVRFHRPGDAPAAAGRDFEQPVDHVRVLPGPADQVVQMANGWPASIVRPLGRGRILFTALGPAAWQRIPTATARPPKSKLPSAPPTTPVAAPGPVATPQLEELSVELSSRSKPHPFTTENLRPLLTEEIGYSVPSRGLALGILGAFLAALVILGVGLRRSRRPELVGWLAPVAALAAGGLFLAIGISTRRAVPPTTGTVAIADVVPGSGEAAVSGLFAIYQPQSGPADLGTRQASMIDLDPEGLEGQSRLRIQTDTGAWHMEGLSLPAGVRTGPFQTIARAGPMAAVVRFGPEGVEGRVSTGDYHAVGDALITTPAREPLAVPIRSDGTFAAGPADQLPQGQFLAGAVLTDQQQRRQTVYRQLLTIPEPGRELPVYRPPPHMDGRDLLLTWAEPTQLPFTGREGARMVGTSLLVLPLEYERTEPGTRVTIPPAFLPYRRLADGVLRTPTMESPYPVDMELRFQLPAAVLPMTVERAIVQLRIRAPSRRVTIAGIVDGRPEALHSEENPAGPFRVTMTDPRHLRLDDQGGLHLQLSVANLGTGPLDSSWQIESLTIEVAGRVGP